MTAILLDTSVASHLHPRRARVDVRRFFEPYLVGKVLSVSFQTQAELWAWAEENSWGPAARAELDRFMGSFVVVEYTSELGRTWARVMAEARASGRRLEAGDAWIAATEVLHAVPLLTTDADFVGLGLSGLSVIAPPR